MEALLRTGGDIDAEEIRGVIASLQEALAETDAALESLESLPPAKRAKVGAGDGAGDGAGAGAGVGAGGSAAGDAGGGARPAEPVSVDVASATPGFEPLPEPPAALAGALWRDRAPGGAGAPHPRSKYRVSEPDFRALAEAFPSLARHVREFPARGGRAGGWSLDFRDAAATRELTRVLLRADWGLQWWLPDGHLVPPLTNRTNYIHWVEDLLALSAPPWGDGVAGLDVGTGASCIYALLGAKLNGWRMVAVDVTDEAVGGAAANVAANPELVGLVDVRRVTPPPGVSHPSVGFSPAAARTGLDALPRQTADVVGLGAAAAGRGAGRGEGALKWASGGVLLPALRPGERVSFTMCNPPFFAREDEAGQGRSGEYAGTPAEVACPGGEERFVRRMVADSFALRDRVWWFTTMVGKKATMRGLRQLLHALGVPVVRSTTFTQGQTERWGVAWSFAAPRGEAMGPMPRAGFHSSGTGFFSAAEGEGGARPAALPTTRASAEVHAPSAAAVLGAIRGALGEAGFAEGAVDEAGMSVGGSRGPVSLEAAVRESPGARRGPGGTDFVVAIELRSDLKGDLAASTAFTAAARDLADRIRGRLGVAGRGGGDGRR